MRSWSALTSLFLAAAVTVALATHAFAAPVADQYLPFVPSAAGEEVVAGDKSGPGASILAPAVRGSKGEGADSGDEGSTGGEASSGDSSSGALDTLADPVALLVIVGVGGAAFGMTLRRARPGEGGGNADRAPLDPGSAPPTPDGEIGGGEPRS